MFILSFALIPSLGIGAAAAIEPGDNERDVLALFAGDEPNQTRTRRVGVDDGLPSLSIKALAQDHDGFLWVGTYGGLFAYDGATFRPLTEEQREILGGERITALHVDRNGALWVACADGFLVRFSHGRFERVPGLAHLTNVGHILECADGTLCFGNHRLVCLKPSGEIEESSFEQWPAAPPLDATDQGDQGGSLREPMRSVVLALSQAPSGGSVYATTNDGLWAWSAEEGLRKLHGEPRSCHFFDGDGVVWELGWDGTFFADGQERFQNSLARGCFHCSHRLRDGRLFLGMEFESFLFDGAGTEAGFIGHGAGRHVHALVEQWAEGYWLATPRRGLLFVDEREQVAPPIDSDLRGANVEFVAQATEKQVLVASSSSGLIASVQQGAGNELEVLTVTPPQDHHPRIFGAAFSGGGEVWVATSMGVCRLDGTELKSIPGLEASAHALAATDDGAVWVRQDFDLVETRGGVRTGRTLPANGRWNEQFVARGRFLYRTTPSSIVRHDLETLAGTVVATCTESRIRSMYFDDDGSLWFTTYGSGLRRLRTDGTLDSWSTEEGLPERFLGWVGAVPGPTAATDLWINSNLGTLRVSRRSLEAVASGELSQLDCRVIPTSEGNGVGGAYFGDGTLVLPTLLGLAVVNTGAAAAAAPLPNVLLRGIRADDVRVAGAGELDFVGKTDLEFSFDVVYLPSSRLVETQAKLIGYDDDWVLGGAERSRRYTRLGAGEYRFALRARSRAGEWTDPVFSELVTIRLVWHQFVWVRVWAALCLVLCALFGTRWRTRALRRRSHVLEAEISRRMVAEDGLRISRERYRSLFRTSPMAIVAWTPELDVIECNEHAAGLFGWECTEESPADGTAPKLLSMMVGEAAVAAMALAIRDVLAGGQGSHTCVQTLIGHEDVRRCRWHLAALPSLDGAHQAFLSLVVDLSEEERVEHEFQALRRQLARAEENERARIARELHDDLSQRIAAVALELQLSELRVADFGDADLADSFGGIRVSVEAVASDVHSISRQLHPTVLDDLGLLAALRSECSRRARRGGIEIHFDGALTSGEPGGAAALALFRVVQEALRNALKHGRAETVFVRVAERDGLTELSVDDDGHGFVMPSHGAGEAFGGGGIGLASMRERMLLVGGDLHVTTRLGSGTVVRARLPMARGNSEGGLPPSRSAGKPDGGSTSL